VRAELEVTRVLQRRVIAAESTVDMERRRAEAAAQQAAAALRDARAAHAAVDCEAHALRTRLQSVELQLTAMSQQVCERHPDRIDHSHARCTQRVRETPALRRYARERTQMEVVQRQERESKHTVERLSDELAHAHAVEAETKEQKVIVPAATR
jgi:hypothetical protein